MKTLIISLFLTSMCHAQVNWNRVSGAVNSILSNSSPSPIQYQQNSPRRTRNTHYDPNGRLIGYSEYRGNFIVFFNANGQRIGMKRRR